MIVNMPDWGMLTSRRSADAQCRCKYFCCLNTSDIALGRIHGYRGPDVILLIKTVHLIDPVTAVGTQRGCD